MATMILFPRQDGGTPVAVTVDANPSRVHTHKADITEEPVESGPNTSDNYRSALDEFTLEVIFSDQHIRHHPDFTDGVSADYSRVDLGDGNGAVTLQTDGDSDRSQRVYDEILRVQREGILVEVITSRRRYVDVAFRVVTVTENAITGKALSVKLDCKSLRLVETSTASVAVPRRPRGRSRRNAGANNGEDSNSGDSQAAGPPRRSFLAGLVS